MKKVDRLIISELFGPWLMGVAMFSTLLLAATYLGTLTGLIVDGVPFGTVVKVTALVLPPTLISTFAMATLLGALLAFGRLSGDSEIVALRAGGASIYRILTPVAFFTIIVAAVTFLLNDTLVPYATKQKESLIREVTKTTKARAVQPTFSVQTEDDRVTATIQALDFSLQTGTLNDVIITGIDSERQPTFLLFAKQLKYTGSKTDWRIIGEATLMSYDGRDRSILRDGLWPGRIPKINATPQELTAQKISDPNYFTTSELREQIRQAAITKSMTPSDVRNREFWFWTKFTIPLAAFVFGILGAALGIRSHRAGTGTGFALSIGIMFAYQVISNFGATWAMGGAIPPALAAFVPLILGLFAAGVIMWRRNNG
jgi:lipopolysaccharide export system permease protein